MTCLHYLNNYVRYINTIEFLLFYLKLTWFNSNELMESLRKLGIYISFRVPVETIRNVHSNRNIVIIDKKRYGTADIYWHGMSFEKYGL